MGAYAAGGRQESRSRPQEGFPVLSLGMIALGLATFVGGFAFVRFCEWV